MQANNPSAAQKYFRRDLELAEKLAKTDPDNASASFDVVLSHFALTRVAATENDFASAREHVMAANAILEAMDQRGQIDGFRQREELRTIIARLARELAKEE